MQGGSPKMIARFKLAAAGTAAWMCCLALALACRAEAPQQSGPLGRKPTAVEVELGRKLFFDGRLSQDGSIACATCHDPRKGWADGRELAVGIGGQRGTRHSPTVLNSSYVPLVFWDGRAATTVTQALLPLANPIEMGRQSEADVVRRLRLIPGYVSLFADVYGVDVPSGSPVTGSRLAQAIAAFESTLVSFDAPIDRYLAGDKQALSTDALVGLAVFERAKCTDCHVPPLYTDHAFHNNGMEFAGKVASNDRGRADVLPRSAQTASTVRAFKTPTLREIARTAPYNHAGNFADLDRVLVHYAAGGKRFDNRIDANMDPRIVEIGKLQIGGQQRKYLALFLKEAFASPTYPLVTEPVLP